MHELSILEGIIKSVNSVKTQKNIKKVDDITLEIGEMSDIVPAFLTEAWKSIQQNSSDYKDTTLTIEIVKAKAKCLDCEGEEFVKNIDLKCNKCGSLNLKIISGREFKIKNITAEVD